MQDIARGKVALYHDIKPQTPAGEAELALNHKYMKAIQLVPQTPMWARGLLDPEKLDKMPGMVQFGLATILAKAIVDYARGGNFFAVAYLRHYWNHSFGKGRLLNRPRNAKLWKNPAFPFNLTRMLDRAFWEDGKPIDGAYVPPVLPVAGGKEEVEAARELRLTGGR
jgi:hypothetical protein